MHIFTVSLFGHRMLRNPAAMESALEETVLRLLREHEFVEFLIGRNGDFDLLAASVIRRCRRSAGGENSAMILILPYETAEYRNDLPARWPIMTMYGCARKRRWGISARPWRRATARWSINRICSSAAWRRRRAAQPVRWNMRRRRAWRM